MKKKENFEGNLNKQKTIEKEISELYQQNKFIENKLKEVEKERKNDRSIIKNMESEVILKISMNNFIV